MANTVIALKKSGTPSATPSGLANGELAINYADGKLFYKAANGNILAFSSGTSTNSFSTINANGTLVVADSSNNILTIVPDNNITIVGDAINDKITIGLSNEVVIAGALYVKATGGDEGGQIELANAVTNSVLAGNVVVDIYQNKLRFFEKGSPNKGAFINLAATATSVGTDLLAASSGADATARAAASAAFDKANSALPNTNGVTFAGTLTATANLVADKFVSLNNANGENFKVGDDAWIGDTNVADTIRIKGLFNPFNAYIAFGNNDGILLGRSGSGNLTYGNNTVWHAGIDGAGSGLDADLLDGQQGSYYSGIGSAAFDKANSANVLAYNTGISSNAYATTVGTAGNTYLLATLAGANSAVGTGANAYAASIGTAANSYMISVQNGSNTAVGTGANSVGIAAFAQANTKFSSSGGTINGDVSISGNLSVTGNTIWTNVSSFIVNDPLIYLAGNNYVSDIVDIGFVANYVNATGANVHTGLFRDAGTKEYYVFEGYDKEPYNNVIDIAANGFTTSVLNATLRTSNIILGGTNTINWINAAFSAANAAVTATTLSGANTAIGTGANTVGSAAFAQANAAYAQANSGNALIYVDSVSASRYLTFTDSVSGTLDRANIGYGLTFNPSSNQLTISHATAGPRLTLTQTGSSVQPSYLIFNRTTATSGAFYGAIQWSTTASDSSNTMTSSIQASGSTIMPSQRQTLTYSAFTDHRFQVGTGSGNTQFANASVEVVRIDNSGNVGIGTTSPTTKLHVVGDANVSTTLTVAGYNVVATMGAAFDKANTANLYAFFVDSNTIAAFAKANAANIAAGAAFDGDNVTRIIANAAFAKANTAGSGGGGSYQGNNGVVNPSGYGDIFRVHSQTLSANVYISTGNNSLAAGPITIATGYRLQINTGARVAIV